MKCTNCHADNPDTTKFCGECGTSLTAQDEATELFSKTLILPTQELTRGTLFANRFEIIEELGRGGMGNVFRVEDTKINEEVALKIIKPEIASDPTNIKRFRNELITARKIRHKNICGMYEFGEENQTYYITMEYIHGEDLRSFMKRSKQLSIPTAISITKQVCEGLSEAHSMGVVHRDLKPNNIMIDQGGNARIMDFGIAQSVTTKGLTKSGVMIGTPEYMSPEQVEGSELDARSDIYSLGVILYELVTGSVPFGGNTPMSVALKRVREVPAEPRKLSSQIPVELSKVIMTCLNKDRKKRYQSTKELFEALSEIDSKLSTTGKVIPKSKTHTSKEITVSLKPKKILFISASICMLAAIGIFLWIFVFKQDTQITVVSSETQSGPAEAVSEPSTPPLQSPDIESIPEKVPAPVEKTEVKPAKKEPGISTFLRQAQDAFSSGYFQASIDLSRKILRINPNHVEAAKIIKLAEQELTKLYVVQLIERFDSAVNNKTLPEFYQQACTPEFYKKIQKDAELIVISFESFKSVTSEHTLDFVEDDRLLVSFPNITMGISEQGARQQVLFDGIYIWEMNRIEGSWKIIGIKTK